MAFHPYPRVIPPVFNRGGFGPPRGLTPASACPWIAHPASRPRRATERPVQTRFRCGSPMLGLAARRDSQAHSTKGTPSHRKGCSDCLRAHGFRCCFTPLSGCFSPFPHGTRSLSVIGECLALEGGPPSFGPGFTCPVLLGLRTRGGDPSAYGALTRSGRPSHAVPLESPFLTARGRWRTRTVRARNPHAATPPGFDAHMGLGSRAFARRYSRVLD